MLLDSSYQRVKRLFILAYDNTGDNPVTANSRRRIFYGQPNNDLIKQYDEVRKISRGQGADYTTGCLLDFAYFKKSYRLIAVDLSKQKALDADPRVIQQIVFQGNVGGADNKKIGLYTILEK